MKGAGSVWFVCCVSVCKRLRGDVRLDVVGGVRKLEGIPKHESYETTCAIHERHGDKESPKVCTRFKSCESLYTCPRAPFYRETKRLLHSEITLESKEYS
jgi:hypothetical protein